MNALQNLKMCQILRVCCYSMCVFFASLFTLHNLLFSFSWQTKKAWCIYNNIISACWLNCRFHGNSTLTFYLNRGMAVYTPLHVLYCHKRTSSKCATSAMADFADHRHPRMHYSSLGLSVMHFSKWTLKLAWNEN